MLLHPSIHLEIARHTELMVRAERHRIAEAALEGGHEDRSRPLKEQFAMSEPSSRRTADSPRRAEA
jgi:hypothetical protein